MILLESINVATWVSSADWGDVLAIFVGLLIYLLSFIFKRATDAKKGGQPAPEEFDESDYPELPQELMPEEEPQEAFEPDYSAGGETAGQAAAQLRATSLRAEALELNRRIDRLSQVGAERDELRFIVAKLEGRLKPRCKQFDSTLQSLVRHATEQPDDLISGVSRIERGVAELRAVVDYLETTARERLLPERAVSLGRLDTLCDTVLQPGYRSLARAAGLGRQLQPLFTYNPIPAEVIPLVAALGLLPIRVERTRIGKMHEIVSLMTAVIASLLEALPRLDAEVRHVFSNPAQQSEKLARMIGTPSAPSDALPPWYRVVFADVIAAMYLGPHYFLSLAAKDKRGEDLWQVYRPEPVGAQSPKPEPLPASRRLWAPAVASLAKGSDDPAVAPRFDEWREQVGVGLLETSEGDKVVPLDDSARELYFRTLALLGHRFQSLRGASLPSLESLAIRRPHDERAERKVRELHNEQRLPDGPVEEILRAALRAEVLTPAVGRSVTAALMAGVARTRARAKTEADATDELNFSRPSPSLLADAIAFQAIFDER